MEYMARPAEGEVNMERLTYDFVVGGTHCWQIHGADNELCEDVCKRYSESGCKNCPIGHAFDRLAAYENTGLEPKQVQKISNVFRQFGEEYNCWFDYVVDFVCKYAKAEQDGRLVELPFVAMVEQSLQDGKMTPQKDQRFNGRYAVVYMDEKKWKSPLIDICGRHYDREQAEFRRSELTREEAEATLSAQGGTQ